MTEREKAILLLPLLLIRGGYLGWTHCQHSRTAPDPAKLEPNRCRCGLHVARLQPDAADGRWRHSPSVSLTPMGRCAAMRGT